jgi:hypothetical protein
MRLLCQVIEHTGDLTLLTDGERRYGSLLFELCSQALRNGKRGRPKKTLPKGVKVRLKNKGSQRHKRGRKRPTYQAPYPEHPDTAQPIATHEIHANHLEAFHTSLRRRCAAYRRRTNMYAKKTGRLQERLNQTTRDSYTHISGHPWVACARRTKRDSATYPCAQRTLPRVYQCHVARIWTRPRCQGLGE